MRTPVLAVLTACILAAASPALADVGAELAPKLLGTWLGESAECKVRVDFAATEEANVVAFSYVLAGCGAVMESRTLPDFRLVAFEDRDHRELFAFRKVGPNGFNDAHSSGRYLAASVQQDGGLAFNFGGWAAFGDAYSIDARLVYLTKQEP